MQSSHQLKSALNLYPAIKYCLRKVKRNQLMNKPIPLFNLKNEIFYSQFFFNFTFFKRKKTFDKSRTFQRPNFIKKVFIFARSSNNWLRIYM